MNIRASYDAAARAYADHIADELVQKPLDRHLLDRFAEATRDRGVSADLGCGPGHVAAYLHGRGITVVGFDLSPGMVSEAGRLYPDLSFRIGDFATLDLPDAALAGAVAFYAIVHLDQSELELVFTEWRRVLALGGALLIAFHVGDETVREDDMWGVPVALDFRFHKPDAVIGALEAAGFRVTEQAEREPYEGVEVASRRCYLFAQAV